MLSQLLFACARFEADCSFDQAVYEQVLATMIEFGCELDPNQVRDWIKQQERLSLRALGGVSLPGLKRLSMADIAAVRRNSDGFEGWRASLSEGLNWLEVDAASDQMVTAVQESLAQGKEKVEREIGSTGLSEALRGPAQNFGIGTVATVAAGGELSLVVGGTSAAMTALAEFFRGRKKRKSAKALRAYYSILDA